MKKILTVFLISFIAFASGCQQNVAATSGPTKTYKVVESDISFATPASPWEEKVQTVGDEVVGELGNPISADTVLGVTFRRPEKDGLISVGVLPQQTDEEGKVVELENDQETLNQIAMWVQKRDGKRLEEEYIKVLGVNAYHMVFEVGDEEHLQKGEQVHFTKDGKHYSLSIIVPAQDYKSEVGHFRNLVSSFKIQPRKAEKEL